MKDARLAQVLISPDASIHTVLEAIDRNGLRGVIVCDEDQELLGIVMDADIRRAILRNAALNASVKTIMRTPAFVLDARLRPDERGRRLIDSGKLLAPVVDERRRVVDYMVIEEVLKGLSAHPAEPRTAGLVPPAKILVIGGAGYIGSVLVDALAGEGYGVRVLDLLLYGKEAVRRMERERVEFIRGDCRHEETVQRALEGVDGVVHLGEIVGDPACQINETFTIDTNYAATHLIVESCMKRKIQRFVFASSCSVYGQNDDEVDEESPTNPVSLYARCKVESEKAVLSFGNGRLCPTILRLATVHGRSPRQRLDLVVNLLTVKALAEKRIPIMGGMQWRPFIAVRDVCRGVLKVLQAESRVVHNQVFNLGDSHENYQLLQIGQIIHDLVPGAALDVLTEETDNRNYRVSFEKVRRELGFAARYRVRDTVEELARAYQEERLFHDYESARYSNVLALREGTSVIA